MLRRAGVDSIIGGEFEQALAAPRAASAGGRTGISLERQQFLVPDRTGLPPLGAYAHLVTIGGTRPVGYTEASAAAASTCAATARWCRCIAASSASCSAKSCWRTSARQVAAGAEHITFGDPDFFNGPGHATRIVEALHREWPALTYDVTIKIEHLLKHRELLPGTEGHRLRCSSPAPWNRWTTRCWRSWQRATRAPTSSKRST